VRLRTTAAKRFKKVENATALIWKLLQVAQSTLDAAEHLGADRLGMIVPGHFADLLLVEGDPTVNISALRNVVMVMKNGEILIDRFSGLST